MNWLSKLKITRLDRYIIGKFLGTYFFASKDGGAEMVAGLKLSEYDFAMKFIPQVKEKLEAAGYDVVVTSRE